MTSYEMRISDWSSDVCSSDLTITHVLVMGNEALQATLGKSGITKYRSKEYDLPAGMRTITAIPTIAHTAVKRNLGQYSGFMSDSSEEHTSELQSLMRNSYAVVCLQKKTQN